MKPPPIYRKPDLVTPTADDWQAWAKRCAEPAADRLARMLDDESAALRDFLRDHGVPVRKRLQKVRPQPGVTYASVDGGFACYRKSDLHPAVVEAVEALAAVEHLRRSTGEWRVLAALDLGAAIERVRASAAFARAIDSYQRGRAKPVTPDAAIMARLAARKPGERLADIAAALRMSERQLRTRRKRIDANRKSVRPPPKK